MAGIRRFQLFVGLLVAIAVLSNVAIFLHDNDTSVSNYIGYSETLPSIDSKQGAVSAGDIADCKDGQYAKVSSCSERVIQDLRNEFKDVVLSQLKKEVKMTEYDKIQAEIKDKIHSEFTKNLFVQEQVDGSLLSEMKESVVRLSEEQVKMFLAKDVLTALKEDKEFADVIGDVNLDMILDKFKFENIRTNFIQHVFENVFEKLKPEAEPFTKEEKGSEMGTHYLGTAFQKVLSYEELIKGVNPSADAFAELRSKHDSFVSLVRNLKTPDTMYLGKGIVISAGKSTLGSALVLIAQLKELKTTYPIELVLDSKDDYDKTLCDTILPKEFNTKCVLMDPKIVEKVSKADKNLAGFQFKSLGLFFSSFEEIISLDADNLPIENIDSLFYSDAYTKTGFVLWPDIWQKTTSPKYYDVARFEPGEVSSRFGISNEDKFVEYLAKDRTKETAFHDLDGIPSMRTVESGQMVINKSQHIRSLVLAIYYNLYGPSHYYDLLYQGGPGVGDKETYIPALEVFEEPYHLVERDPGYLGLKLGPDGSGPFQETTLVQHEPDQSRYILRKWKSFLRGKQLDTRAWPFQENAFSRQLLTEFENQLEPEFSKPKPLFLHVHKPKFNPFTNYKGELGIMERRILGEPDKYKEVLGEKTDWELRFQALSKYVACSLKSETLYGMLGLDKDEVCGKITKRVEELTKDSPAPEFAELKQVGVEAKPESKPEGQAAQ